MIKTQVPKISYFDDNNILLQQSTPGDNNSKKSVRTF